MNTLRMGACIAVILAASSIGSIAARAADKPRQILLTVEEMRQVGVALRILDSKSGPFNQQSAGFANKCYYDPRYELSISNEMLAHFKKRGFTLATLCLAIQGYSRFDVEAGNPLPLAVPAVVRDGKKVAIWEDAGILLNVPDCYKAGIPILDCKRNYDFIFGTANHDNEETRKDIRGYDEKEHAGMSAAARQGYKKQCSCAEIKVGKEHELVLPGTCRVDTLPACAANRLPNQTAAGTLVTENYSSFREAAQVSGSQHGRYDISAALPHGYGYMIAGPEGDDPEPEIMDLVTARKQALTAAPWLPRR